MWVQKSGYKNIFSLENFGSKKILVAKKIWSKNQDKFGPDKCALMKCLKHLGSTYICEFWLLAKCQLSELSKSSRNR